MRKIYLLRHCETEYSNEKRCIGITDVELSESGRKHAQCLKEYLAGKGISSVFCSDAHRASETADIISDEKIQITKLNGLCEINMGEWDGMYFDDIKSKFPDEYMQRGYNFSTFAPPGGESFADCQQRAISVFNSILNNTDGNIAVVSHAGFNRALICSLFKIALNELFSIPQPFGCVNILSVENGVCNVQKIGLEINN